MAISATERIVNLAIFLAHAARPMSAAEIASGVAGYSPEQKPETFARMFERDKDDLRRAGLVITVDRSGEVERYRFDPASTYAGLLDLTPLERAELRAAVAAMLADDSFPYTEELRTAVAKLVAGTERRLGTSPAVIPSASADEDSADQAEAVALLTQAIEASKRVAFGYTGASGRRSQREIEPWGLFARDGRWYVVAWDPVAESERVFAVTRMTDVTVNAQRPKTPDFARPEGFDVASWMLMPFQYGPRPREAVLRFSGAAAQRAYALAAGQGTLEPHGQTYVWRVPVADAGLLARWIVENGPRIEALEPADLCHVLTAGLTRVVELHG